jgi:hypothetical protein
MLNWKEPPDPRSGGQKFRDDEWSRIEDTCVKNRFARHIEINAHYLTGEKCPKCGSPMFWSEGKPDYCSLCKREKRNEVYIAEREKELEIPKEKLCLECGHAAKYRGGLCIKCWQNSHN